MFTCTIELILHAQMAEQKYMYQNEKCHLYVKNLILITDKTLRTITVLRIRCYVNNCKIMYGEISRIRGDIE